jgi:hypothetical protein
MSERNTAWRAMNDIGLAAWFGGSLMGAVGVNGAASDVDDPRQRARVANAGWARWTPFNLVAIGAHVVGATGLTIANRRRLQHQKGVGKAGFAKAVLTAGALGLTAYSRALGQKVMDAGDVPVEGGTTPAPSTPAEVAKAQDQLATLQWAIPAVTGAMLGVNSLMGEQQRPQQVASGLGKTARDRARRIRRGALA